MLYYMECKCIGLVTALFSIPLCIFTSQHESHENVIYFYIRITDRQFAVSVPYFALLSWPVIKLDVRSKYSAFIMSAPRNKFMQASLAQVVITMPAHIRDVTMRA